MSHHHHELLKKVGIGLLTEEAITLAEAFVCKIYKLQRTQSVDKGRQLLFAKTGKPEALPPTRNDLRFPLYRVHYQTMVWRQANCPLPDLPSPTEMGWKRTDSGLQPILTSLPPVADSCLDIVSCVCKTSCSTRLCNCKKSNMKCTLMCKCQTVDHACMNAL